MRRALIALVALTLLAGCDRHAPWYSSAPWAPSLPQNFGVRVTDGHLEIWTGTPCRGVKSLDLQFHGVPPLLLESIDPDGVDISHIRFGGPYPGFTVSQPLPEGFDWRSAQELSLGARTVSGSYGATAQLSEAVEKSGEHADDIYYFNDMGWLDSAAVIAENGKAFLTLCTPDPAKQ